MSINGRRGQLPEKERGLVMSENESSLIRELRGVFAFWATSSSADHTDAEEGVIARVRALEESTAWIACSDRMPEPGEQCLVVHQGRDVETMYWSTDLKWLDYPNMRVIVCSPTHWMPWPSPPKEPANG